MTLIVLSADDCIRQDVANLLSGYGAIASLHGIKPLSRKPTAKRLGQVLHRSMGQPWVWLSESK